MFWTELLINDMIHLLSRQKVHALSLLSFNLYVKDSGQLK